MIARKPADDYERLHLSTAGFEVSVIPMADLTQDRCLAWLETVRDVQRRRGPE